MTSTSSDRCGKNICCISEFLCGLSHRCSSAWICVHLWFALNRVALNDDKLPAEGLARME